MSGMRRKSATLKEKLLYAGLPEEEYTEAEESLMELNYRTLRKEVPLGAAALGAMTAVTVLLPGFAVNRAIYLSFLAAMLLIWALTATVAKHDRAAAIPLCYVFLAVAFAFGILLGTWAQPQYPATTFCVLLFALPLLIIDRPYRISVLMALAAAVFCLLSWRLKTPEIAVVDTVNAASFMVLGIIINSQILRTRARDVLRRTRIERARDTDDLTRLMTKAASQREIRRYIAMSDAPAALIVLDVDNFKHANDTYGHAYGDAVLRLVGSCILEVFRQSDILARFGGDEFVIFLPRVGTRQVVEERLEQLLGRLDESLAIPGREERVTCSAGAALYPADAEDYDGLFACADRALYHSKRGGKARYTFFLSGMGPAEHAG